MSKKEYDFENAQQGAVVTPSAGKTRITITHIERHPQGWPEPLSRHDTLR